MEIHLIHKKEETKTENTDNKETPEVDTIHWARANSGNILVTIAKQQGYFDEVGINVIEDPVESSTAALQALQAGQVDVTSNQGTNNPLQFISTGSDFSIVGGYMLKGMYIIGKKDTQYKDVTSLKGSKFAYAGVHPVVGMASYWMQELILIMMLNGLHIVQTVTVLQQ